MPKNPSRRQQQASRRNLEGHYGPRTEEGRSKAARNGLRNKGIKTAKARAHQVAGRWGANTETYYNYAGCLECKKDCQWPSFSVRTPLLKMPLGCLKEVLDAQPARCFYYFEGFCLASYVAAGGIRGSSLCILDGGFADFTARRLGQAGSEPQTVELRERMRIWSLKLEMFGYLQALREKGPRDTEWTARMIHVVREVSTMLPKCTLCRMEPWRRLADLDEVLEQLYFANLVRPEASGKPPGQF